MPKTQKAVMMTAAISALRWLARVDLSPEFLLNVVWFLLAIGTLGLVLPRRSGDVSRRISLLTLICVFALLFPIISANDDMAQQELLNDTSTSQLAVKSLDSGKRTPVHFAKWSMPVAPPPPSGRFEAEVGAADYCFVARAAYLNVPVVHSPPAADCRVLS